MELIALDETFAPCKFINFLELQWVRRFYETGQFSVEIPASEYSSDMKYIFLNERPELGIIQKIEFDENKQGYTMQLSGFFAEKLLDEKITFPSYQTQNRSVGDFFADIWREYIANTDLANAYNMTLSRANDNAINAATIPISKMTTGDAVGEMVQTTLKPQEVGYQAIYEPVSGQLIYSLRKGRDLTQDNTQGNNFVMFSETFGNMPGVILVEDGSNYKNFAVIQGEGEGEARITVTVDQSEGEIVRQLYVDAKDIRQEEGVSLQEYKDQLRQRGIEKLKEHVNICNVEVTASTRSAFKYMEDYDLGDTVDIVINSIGRAFTSQIIAISEVLKGAQHEISITFGDEIPSAWQKARIR